VRAARTSFVGRAAELAALTQALDPTARTGTRLLTLIGTPGCGKTRLGLAVAEAMHAAYADGVWLVELAPVPAGAADPTAVAAATLTALGLQERAGQDLLETLVAYLQPRRLLLVLDNCEHLVAACGTLASRLLSACPQLQLLATSQSRLGLAEETIWRVAPLALPALMEGTPTPEVLQGLGQSEAVQLFVERAHAAQPAFALNAATAPTVAAICHHLDGLPLAIELAAARLGVLPLEEILVRLEDRFALLRQGRRTSADRHQALQTTMDWSCDLLDPSAQALLRRLAVFAGGWELAAAEAVCAGEEVAAADVLELLDELLDHSLVYVAAREGAPRYGMLETVRLYGLQQLERAGEVTALRERHLRWCVLLAEQAALALQGAEQAVWLTRLAREHDNLRGALQWALDGGLSTLGLRLAGDLGKFWLRGGHQREGRAWLAALLALPEEEGPTALAARALALDAAAWLADDMHDFAQAAAWFAQSDALRRAVGQEENTAALLINAAMEARAGGDYARATALLEECLARERALGNRVSGAQGSPEQVLSMANHYTLLALVLREQGAYARATALCEECLALSRELGDAEGIGIALLCLTDLARDQGNAQQVRAYGAECLVLFQELGHLWAIGFALNNLALAAVQEGNLQQAERLAKECVAIFRGQQADPSLAEALVTLGRIRAAQGAADMAQAPLAEALALARAKGPRLVLAAALEEIGVLAARHRRTRHGVEVLGAAATLRAGMGAPVRPADRPALEGALTAARTALGEAAFTTAWAAGQTLPLEQIVAHALAGAGDEQ
jgi:non-specific serine/threonine protein kinase